MLRIFKIGNIRSHNERKNASTYVSFQDNGRLACISLEHQVQLVRPVVRRGTSSIHADNEWKNRGFNVGLRRIPSWMTHVLIPFDSFGGFAPILLAR
jgi:hypothetical protein